MAERKAVVNISERAAGEGLKEALDAEAASWGLTSRNFVGRVYEYALEHKRKFLGRLKEARAKGGAKIPASVSPATARQLTQWAESRGTKRGHHCCYILEKALEDKLVENVFAESRS